MTEPDDGLEEALRRAMSAAPDEAAPGNDGLSKIHAKIRNRPPRPWLLSVLAGWAERARNWTWRGHWAWPSSLRWPAAFPAPRGRPTPRTGLTGTRTAGGALGLGAVLVGIAAVAVISLGVQPFRHAIIQASSTVFNGGSGAKDDGGGGTSGNGAHTLGSNVANFSTTHPAGLGTASAVPSASRSAAAKATQAELCGPATAVAESAPTTAAPAEGDATATLTRSPSTAAAALPTDSPGGTDSDTAKTTCPISTATPTPTASPTPSAATTSSALIAETSPTPTPTAVATTPGLYTIYTWQAPTPLPTWTQSTYSPRPRQQSGTGASSGESRGDGGRRHRG